MVSSLVDLTIHDTKQAWPWAQPRHSHRPTLHRPRPNLSRVGPVNRPANAKRSRAAVSSLVVRALDY